MERIYPLKVTFASLYIGQQFIPERGGLAVKRTNRTADICHLTHNKRVYFKQTDKVLRVMISTLV
ncbi:MAG: hypothetical protein EB117_16770 [Betaproteobacteria bacterium]|nr:hypothetical protein [Betaproteobacteria bacterium]